jgi:hypothetical protein
MIPVPDNDLDVPELPELDLDQPAQPAGRRLRQPDGLAGGHEQ